MVFLDFKMQFSFHQKTNSVGWGVKTYSEIMREKQQKRLAEQQSAEQHLAEQQPSDDTSEQPRKPGKKFTPIVFDDSEKNRTKNDNDIVKTATTKRKFTPVVFDLSNKKEEEPKKSTGVKRFKPIVFDEPTSSDKTKTSPSQQEQHEESALRSMSKDNIGVSRTGSPLVTPVIYAHECIVITTCDFCS